MATPIPHNSGADWEKPLLLGRNIAEGGICNTVATKYRNLRVEWGFVPASTM